jgi:nucleoid-associated protein YgaU
MALSSQRGRFHARGGSPSGWRKRRRAKALRRAAGVVIIASLAIALLVMRPWAGALAGEESAALPASDTILSPETTTDDAPSTDPVGEALALADEIEQSNGGEEDAAPVDTIAAAPERQPIIEEDSRNLEPVSMTMGRPLTPADDTPTAQPESIDPPATETVAQAPERQPLDMSLQRLETTPAAPRSTTNRAGLTFTSPEPVRTMLEDALTAQERNDPVEARALFNRALFNPRITPRDSDLVRERMSALNQLLLFSPTAAPNDPLSATYVIRSGDSLSKIAQQNKLGIDWRLLQRVNRISDPRRIRIGQSLKLVRGPFHAVVHKKAFRIDVFAQMPEGSSEPLMFIESYRVGLGENDSTPAGSWVVRDNSRLINPPWTNPRTGEYFSADNPDNPIGERWVGLRGVDENTQSIQGIGIHGTVEPDSIGKMASMGCVRMLEGDVDVVYELLTEGVSRVEILQ